MSFTTPAGTYGGRKPSGPLVRFFSKMASGRVRKSGRTMGMDALVLTTIGRTSGQERVTPVAWFPAPGGGWLIAASANGAAQNPAWYLNLAAHPDRVTIDVSGRKVAVTAEELHGPERDEAWRQIVAAAPRFAGYETKTDRRIPVIRLRERG
jgi:deazaflavin-dependent oxidoreductase (nitroreductase family)